MAVSGSGWHPAVAADPRRGAAQGRQVSCDWSISLRARLSLIGSCLDSGPGHGAREVRVMRCHGAGRSGNQSWGYSGARLRHSASHR